MNRLPQTIRGVIFDMDGTLCLPQTYMFQQMRDALGIDKSIDILDHVHSLPKQQQEEAQNKLKAIELEVSKDMKPQPGVQNLVRYLHARQLPTAILTRNFDIPVQHLLDNFLDGYPMDPVITREFRPPKPAPDGVLKIAQQWGVDPKTLIMVGDSIDDILAGYRAGSATVLLRNTVNHDVADRPECTCVIDRLEDLIPIMEETVEV